VRSTGKDPPGKHRQKAKDPADAPKAQKGQQEKPSPGQEFGVADRA
jgi:hypothetical protein